MRITQNFFVGLAAFAAAASAVSVPTNDGFPNPSTPQEFQNLATKAGGGAPKSLPPSKFGPKTTAALQLIAFNELFEAAYFNALLQNITKEQMGYHTQDKEKYETVFKKILAQEEVHAVSALNVLKHGNAKFVPSPCQYKFPSVDSIGNAIELAEVFTTVVLGSLQDASTAFADEDASVLVTVTTAIAGNEGEQNGFFRNHLGDVPSESPFLTYVPGAFAFSALQMFIESCPFSLNNIDIPIFPDMTVNGQSFAKVEPKDQTLSFSADLSTCHDASLHAGGSGSGLYMTYITGQELPISVPLQKVHWSGRTINFEAKFPFKNYTMNGLIIGALTTSNNFTAPSAVVRDTLAAPAIVLAQNPVKSH